MKSAGIFATCALFLATAVGCGSADQPEDVTETKQSLGAGPGSVVVAFDMDFDGDAAAVVEAAGGTLDHYLDEVNIALVSTDDLQALGTALDGAANVAQVSVQGAHALPSVEAESHEDAPTPADGAYNAGLLWGIDRVNAPAAWATTTGSHDTVVAVLDTGVAWNHPDLAPNVLSASCVNNAVLYGTGTCSPYPDLHWHGTHVAGTIAGAFDHGPIVGVGPNLGISSYNVFELYDFGGGDVGLVAFDFPLWVAMIDAAAQGADVINMSLGGFVVFPWGPEHAQTWTMWNRVANYVASQGVTVVAAAGNDNYDLNGPVNSIPSDLPGVISVAATGVGPSIFDPQYDVRAFYSNMGASVDVAAPGGDCGPNGCGSPGYWLHLVLSSYVLADPICAQTASCPVANAWAGGTSMATPHVAGVAGLVAEANPGLSAKQIKAKIVREAEQIGSRQKFGHGMVDADASVN